MKSLLPILLIGVLCELSAATFINVYPRLKSIPLAGDEDVGDPLFLTPLIESGKIEEARKRAAVQHKQMNDESSYAGYLTVNKQYNSNLFFWFFPAKVDPAGAPVVLWLQGGPGASSLIGLFLENGPVSVTRNKTLKRRKYSWNVQHNLIYIDSPVGTGFSYTDNEAGYARNESDVGRDVLSALLQFFAFIPELQKNEFYVTGESYAGKYVPAVANAIKQHNAKEGTKINLQGLAIGDGWTDPINQINYGDYLYQLGLIDFNGREEFKALEDKVTDLIRKGDYLEASKALDGTIDGDSSATTLFKNLTGFDVYYNYLYTRESNSSDWFVEFVQQPDFRKAIHVGNHTFSTDPKKVEECLREDITKSVAPVVADLLQHYRILIYNGQLDIICAYPMTVNYLKNLNWPGAQKYEKAARKQWWVGKELAGYSKVVDNLTEVLVRDAGHMVPTDQPKWAWDLISRFTHRKSF